MMSFEIKDGILMKYSGVYDQVIIPEGVIRIEKNAFEKGVYSDIYLPSTLKSVAKGAFNIFARFRTVHITSLETWMGIAFEEALCNLLETGFDLIVNDEKVETLIIPQNVTSIGNNQFSHCWSITKVILPDSVTSISERAFDSCKNLSTIMLTSSLKKIGREAFRYSGLRDIDIPDNTETIGEWAFFKCTALEKVKLPCRLTQISNSLFRECTSLSKIVLPETITYIREMAFNQSGITTIKIPKGIRVIDDRVFTSSALSSIELPEGLEVIDFSSFYMCSKLKNITIPSTVKRIYNFYNMSLMIKNLIIKCNLEVFYSTNKPSHRKMNIYIEEEQLKRAQEIFDKASFFNMNGKKIPADPDVITEANKRKTVLPITVTKEKMKIIYPNGYQKDSEEIRLFLGKNGKPQGFIEPPFSNLQVQVESELFNIDITFIPCLPKIWRRFFFYSHPGVFYDPSTVLGHWMNQDRDKRDPRIIPKSFTIFPRDIQAISTEEARSRVMAFVTSLYQSLRAENIKEILDKATKKKNGMLQKGRVLRLSYLNLIPESDASTYEYVAKNEDDTHLILEVHTKVPVTDEMLQQNYLLQ